jgi:hypothetical protein
MGTGAVIWAKSRDEWTEICERQMESYRAAVYDADGMLLPSGSYSPYHTAPAPTSDDAHADPSGKPPIDWSRITMEVSD